MSGVKHNEPVPPRPKDTCVQWMGERICVLGVVEYIRIFTSDYRKLSWGEVWATFADAYPNQWAVEVYPPLTDLVDEVNIYHLFVLQDGIGGTALNINWGRDRGNY